RATMDTLHFTRHGARPRTGPLVAALVLSSAGCGRVAVRKTNAPDRFDACRVSPVADDRSPRTLQTLRRWDLDAIYHQNPQEAFGRVQALTEKAPQPELLFALAEMSYLLGRKFEKCACGDSLCYYYLCAGYAYHYLYDKGGPIVLARKGEAAKAEPFDPGASPFDPRFRLACDLYNAGLAKCIRAAQGIGRLDPRHELRLSTCDGKGFTLSVVHHGFLWKPEEFGPLLFCEDFQAVGLANQYRTYGLGVPLIATRA